MSKWVNDIKHDADKVKNYVSKMQTTVLIHIYNFISQLNETKHILLCLLLFTVSLAVHITAIFFILKKKFNNNLHTFHYSFLLTHVSSQWEMLRSVLTCCVQCGFWRKTIICYLLIARYVVCLLHHIVSGSLLFCFLYSRFQ